MTDDEAIKAANAEQVTKSNTTIPPLPKEAQEWLKTFSPGLFENYQQVEQTWNHPLTQFSVLLVRDPAFRGSVGEISQNFQKNTVIGYEITWILLIWIFRAWRLSKSATWLTRIWTQAWVSCLFWWGSLFLVPWLIWGKSYQILLASVFRTLIHQFWT
jgi:hypothetical protein